MPSQYFLGEKTVETRSKECGNSAETWIEDIPNTSESVSSAMKKHSSILQLEVVSIFETLVTTRMQGFTSQTTVFLFAVNTFVQHCVPQNNRFFLPKFPNIFCTRNHFGHEMYRRNSKSAWKLIWESDANNLFSCLWKVNGRSVMSALERRTHADVFWWC
jgi:hypothetical protein